MRYFIHLSFDGTAYHGWQVQPHSSSVQQTLQQALATLLRRPEVEVVGAGRTDAGVHASGMVAHFDHPLPQLDAAQLRYKLNRLLPPDIAVGHISAVEDTMHARFSATSRTYHYHIHLHKNPFLRNRSWLVGFPLDFDAMNQATALLMNYTDFTSFSKVDTDAKTNLCTITQAHWQETAPGEWRFTISANRFLRNMVRAIVGTLVEVGRGRLTLEGFRQVIEGKDRCLAGESVPAQGLFLAAVKYGETEN